MIVAPPIKSLPFDLRAAAIFLLISSNFSDFQNIQAQWIGSEKMCLIYQIKGKKSERTILRMNEQSDDYFNVILKNNQKFEIS